VGQVARWFHPSRFPTYLTYPAHLPYLTYPCRCLCFWLLQITRTTPRRRTILHLSQIRLTDAL